MHRLTTLVLLATLGLAASCGGKGADDPSKQVTVGDGDKGKDGEKGNGDKGDGADKGKDGEKPGKDGEKKDDCSGFEIGNIEDVLSKVACEEANVNPGTMPPVDMKGKLEVTLTASPVKAAPGGKVDLLVTFANKSKDPLTLHFKIDPVARFDLEVTDKKGKRADMPAGNPPPPPKGATQPPPSEAKSARLTIAPNGFARARIPWEAMKMKWAPEKYKGTPPERGYPRSPDKPLAKGKYVLKVVTPLVGVTEGVEHEVSAPKTEIEIDK